VTADPAASDALRRRVEEAVGATFKVEEEIGRGGMAVVYRARDTRLRRHVALKVLPPELAFRTDVRSRFVREAQLAAQLSHPHIVPIYAVDDTGGVVYFAMGFVDGEPLARRLSREPRPDVAFVRRVLREVADGLAYAHAHGVVHRDIKPDNILIEAATGRALVTDFGIARAAEGDQRLTATGVAVGTPAYMSPEQAMGDSAVDGRADIYALGVVGWQMLAGELPFQSENTPGMLMKHISEPPRPLHVLRHDLPANLVYAIERAMAKGPAERWPDAHAFRAALADDAPAPAPATPRAVDAPPSDGTGRGPRPEKPWRYNPMREDARSETGAVAIREWRAQREAWRERMQSAALEHEPMSRRERRKLQRQGLLEVTPEERIRGVQRHVVSSAITIGFLAAINFVTSPRFPWFIFPALAIGLGVASRIGSLWVDGIPFSRLFRRQPYAPPAGAGVSSPAAPAQARLPAPDLGGVAPDILAGPHGGTMREAAEAKAVIADVYGRLPDVERASLPDVGATGTALFDRIRQLATALHQLDRDASPDALRKLDERIAEARGAAAGAERDRRLELLERQRTTLADLVARRATVAEQLDSAALLLQTMKLDILKLRSAGIESNIADSTLATQEARAVATDIERLVDAAGEVRKL
jgi:serine/threonine protein kinase